MQTIVILLDPKKLENPDTDLCYVIPKCIEEASNGAIQYNGYTYIGEDYAPIMGIWLKTASADESWPFIAALFQKQKFIENDLYQSAQILISEKDTEKELKNCTLVFPKAS